MILSLPTKHQTGKIEKPHLNKAHQRRWISAVVMSFLSLTVSAADLQVPSETYPTIADAVKGAQAGDVISLAPGLYQENVTIDKPLTLVGSPNHE